MYTNYQATKIVKKVFKFTLATLNVLQSLQLHVTIGYYNCREPITHIVV